MELTNKPFVQAINPAAMLKSGLVGAGIALVVILLFILPVNQPHADWGKFWMIRPLIITPVAGAAGGACCYFLDLIRKTYNWNKALTIFLSAFIYIIGLWMGIVLGLVGTLWN